jgi:glucokinase
MGLRAGGAGELYFVGVDAGGTTIKAGLLTADLGLCGQFSVPTPRAAGPDAVVAAVLAAVTDAVALGTRQFGTSPAAVGLAVLGLVDEAAGVAVNSAAAGWRDVPLADLVRRTVSVPLGFGHDLRAAALAEAELGAGRGLDSFLFVALGTGVGATLVLDGKPFAGTHGRAGEIGHVPVRGRADRCPCGAVGCLETIASARAIAARYARWTGCPAPDGAQVARLARQGDRVAAGIWSDAVYALGEVLAATVTVTDPAAIVLGGGLAQSGEQLLAPVREELATRLSLGPPPPVVPAALGDQAALVGAGLLARRALAGAGTKTRR